MSSPNGEGTSSIPPPIAQKSGLKTALEYTGIPSSWLNKRPTLPSRNWLIFISVTSSVAGLFIYDRYQCKQIRKNYVDKVKHLAEEPLAVTDKARKVTVYGAKWPGDEEFEQSLKYFRKYVKPILVAAAVDFELVKARRHGDIANRIASEIQARRRLDLGLDTLPAMVVALPSHKSLEETRKIELEGGIVLVGRPSFKEFMFGLKKGWTDGLEKVDKEEQLALELASDGAFDEPEELTIDASLQDMSSRLPSSQNSPVFSPLQIRPSPPPSPSSTSASIPESANKPPSTIPPVPPILFVNFTNYIGLKQIPLMIWDFFNQRHKVRSGAEAGYRLVMGHTRPFNAPPDSPEPLFADITTPPTNRELSDLDFDKKAESYYGKSLSKIPENIEEARKKYYDALPAKLEIARALARGTREPTKEESAHPPPTEVELRDERMKKEQRWRGDLIGWDIVKPSQPVTWDERFRNALGVFIDPPPGSEDTGKDLSN